jgi:hypothetical protein
MEYKPSTSVYEQKHMRPRKKVVVQGGGNEADIKDPAQLQRPPCFSRSSNLSYINIFALAITSYTSLWVTLRTASAAPVVSRPDARFSSLQLLRNLIVRTYLRLIGVSALKNPPRRNSLSKGFFKRPRRFPISQHHMCKDTTHPGPRRRIRCNTPWNRHRFHLKKRTTSLSSRRSRKTDQRGDAPLKGTTARAHICL